MIAKWERDALNSPDNDNQVYLDINLESDDELSLLSADEFGSVEVDEEPEEDEYQPSALWDNVLVSEEVSSLEEAMAGRTLKLNKLAFGRFTEGERNFDLESMPEWGFLMVLFEMMNLPNLHKKEVMVEEKTVKRKKGLME
jgi:hypothetical protein